MAECGEALAVGVALASEVQFRLIAYTDKEGAGTSGTYFVAGDRNGPVAVAKSGVVRRLVSDGGQKLAVVGQSALYDFNLDRLRVVVRPNGPIESASRI